MIEILIQGLLLGGLYCLFALGQSLMFGVMRLTNTAQHRAVSAATGPRQGPLGDVGRFGLQKDERRDGRAVE